MPRLSSADLDAAQSGTLAAAYLHLDEKAPHLHVTRERDPSAKRRASEVDSLGDTVKSTAPPSVALASETLTAGVVPGAATVSDGACESGRSSSVQITPLAPQSVVSGSVIVTSSLPLGSTVMFHPWLLPCCLRARPPCTDPPVTSNASSRSVSG